jgi:G:T-mismatch repair DNA endonuclease (very short patch repair protein)
MADVLTKSQGSFNMSRIRLGKTISEMKLKKILISFGIEGFRERVKSLPGNPYFYLPQYKVVIFIDVCF